MDFPQRKNFFYCNYVTKVGIGLKHAEFKKISATLDLRPETKEVDFLFPRHCYIAKVYSSYLNGLDSGLRFSSRDLSQSGGAEKFFS